MNILINAYACSPSMGSEPGMGWNWCVHLAKHCELHIITEGEFREKIELALPTLEQGCNMHFYYLPVTDKVRRMCWNQGDWRFYHYYKQWQLKAAQLACKICQKERIDILHQLNMIGFREPGYLWKVSQETGIPFVWGPIGGMKQFPIKYAQDGSWKMNMFMRLKNFLNIWQLKHDDRVENALRQASLLISSIPDSHQAIKKYKGLESVIIPETGTFPIKEPSIKPLQFKNKELTLVWVGKFDFRKRLDLAIAAVAMTRNDKIVLRIFGGGNKKHQEAAIEQAEKLGVASQIQWMGNCPYNQVKQAMSHADLFFFTSVSEDTSTVILEAISNNLPVLCFNACGMAAVVNDQVGVKIPLTNPAQSVKDFAQKINYLYHHREALVAMSNHCRPLAEKLSWERKAETVAAYYHDILKSENRVSTC